MYKAIVVFLRFILRIAFGLRIEGHDNIPDGGAIIAANHVTLLDPVAIACSIKRPLHFMAKEELFRNRFLGMIFRKVHAFPVKRGMADRSAIRTALQIVKDDKLLGIFPEGTRNKGDDLLPLQGGTALIAMKAGVPIIPVVVTGFSPSRFRRPIVVQIGKPLDFGGPKKVTKQQIEEASLVISKQFRRMLRRNIV